MWAINVVVVDELGEETVEVSLVDDDHVIQRLGADRAHKSFCDGVRAGGPDRSSDTRDAQFGQPGSERTAVDSVTVVDEVSGLPPPRSRLDHLLPDPRRGRTRGHIEVDQLTTVVPDEEEDVEDPVVDGVDHQQIGRPDSCELV